MLGAFEGIEYVINNLGNFGIGVDLACSWAAVCWKGSLGNDDPVSIAQLVDLLVNRAFPIAGMSE